MIAVERSQFSAEKAGIIHVVFTFLSSNEKTPRRPFGPKNLVQRRWGLLQLWT
jgi:hypothetical protein